MSLPSAMTVIEMQETGGPDVLRPGKRPIPILKDHEILLKVTAAGINGPDLLQRRGHYPPPKGASDLLGLEVSGEVVAVGPGAKNENGKLSSMDVKIGDIVLFGKWSGTEVKIDGKEYSIMKESDIMGVSKSKK